MQSTTAHVLDRIDYRTIKGAANLLTHAAMRLRILGDPQNAKLMQSKSEELKRLISDCINFDPFRD